MRLRHTLLACLSISLVAPCAYAGKFDNATGKFALDSAYSSSLDAPSVDLPITAYTLAGSAVSQETLASRFVKDATALEGKGAFFVGGAVYRVGMSLGSLSSKLTGRRVNVRLWQRPGAPGNPQLGTQAEVYISWLSAGEEIATVRFTPTGRGTDDGFRELETGPIDFALAHVLAPTIFIRDLAVRNTTLDPGAVFPTSGVDARDDTRVAIDAFEIQDLGAAAVPDAACTLTNEDAVCGASGVCFAGKCADAASVLGTVPQDAEVRKAYVDRVRFVTRTFSGGRYALSHMADVDAQMATATSFADAKSFWKALRSIEALRDAHSSPVSGFPTTAPDLGICLGAGAADLLPGADATAAVPIVYQSDAKKAGGALVQPGDVLTRVNGVPVAAFMDGAKRLFFQPGDPRSAAVYQSLLLPGIAAHTGAMLEFARCDRASHSTTPCTANEVVIIKVDAAALAGAKIWNGNLTTADITRTPCDSRFTRPIQGAQTYEYAFAGSVDLAADTRLLMINGVPAEVYEGGPEWKAAVQNAVSVPRAKFLLDEREGNGGWSDPAFPLLFGSFFDGPVPVRAELIPNLESAQLESSLGPMRTCWSASSKECAQYLQFVYDGTGFSKNNAASKLALLGGLDVSGNDYLTRMIKTRNGPTRLFSPVPTMGGYGSVMMFPTYMVAASGGSLQIQDSIFTSADKDPNRVFESAVGVSPDEVVLEKQSDAINGQDTLMNAARAWLEAP